MKIKLFLSTILTLIVLCSGFSSLAQTRSTNPGKDPNEEKRKAQYEADVAAVGNCTTCIARLKAQYRLGDDTAFRANKDRKDDSTQKDKAGTK